MSEINEGGRESWLQHNYTKAQRKMSMEAREKYLRLLLTTCGNSKDPDVLRIFNLWAAQDTLVRFLGGESEADVGGAKKKNGGVDDGPRTRE